MISYELQLTDTAGSTGYFSCLPAEPIDVGSALDYLRKHPFDEFMHRYLLRYLGYWTPDRMKNTLRENRKDAVLMALCLEACLVYEKFRSGIAEFSPDERHRLAAFSPLIVIRSAMDEIHPERAKWVEIFRENIQSHAPLPKADFSGMPAGLCGTGKDPTWNLPAVKLNDIGLTPIDSPLGRINNGIPSLQETFDKAMAKLKALGIPEGVEMRHVSSLSPVGLLHQWRLQLRVENGRHTFSITGIQTAYGKGMTPEAARASYAMEIIERCSSFASASLEEGIVDRTRPMPLIQGSADDMSGNEIPFIEPDRFDIDVPYRGEPLVWLTGEQISASGAGPVLVPAQCVFLFANFDEPSLFSGLGSTGLASGNTMAQARLHALLEIFERHAEATTPYTPDDCFQLHSEDPKLASLLADYESRGIYVWFQDIGQTFGVPCYKSFVAGADGIAKGVSAHLNAKRAVLSALTETPFPYPENPPSRPRPSGLKPVLFESLPNYASGNPETDCSHLERLLIKNGYQPVYVNLTRSDLQIPVVRALVPGLALSADFDSFSRIHPHLIGNYCESFQKNRA